MAHVANSVVFLWMMARLLGSETAADWKRTLFVRNPSTLQIADKSLVVAVGDVANRAAVEQAVADQEAVICALGARTLLRREPHLTLGMHNILVSIGIASWHRCCSRLPKRFA